MTHWQALLIKLLPTMQVPASCLLQLLYQGPSSLASPRLRPSFSSWLTVSKIPVYLLSICILSLLICSCSSHLWWQAIWDCTFWLHFQWKWLCQVGSMANVYWRLECTYSGSCRLYLWSLGSKQCFSQSSICNYSCLIVLLLFYISTFFSYCIFAFALKFDNNWVLICNLLYSLCIYFIYFSIYILNLRGFIL